jgi:hypothetical protein
MPAYGLRSRGAAALLAAFCTLLPAAHARAELPTPTADPTPADIDEAKKHMAAGVAFVQDPDGAKYAEAYSEFNKAYKLSGSLNALQNLGNCAMHLERDGEAIEIFNVFLAKKAADPNDPDRQQVERDLAALRTAVAWVTLTADRDDVTVLDERTPHSGTPIRNTYRVGTKPLRVGVHPGLHRFTASISGMPDRDWRIDISNGSKHQHTFTMEQAAQPAPAGVVAPVPGGPAPTTPAPAPAPDGTPQPPPDAGADDGASIPWYVWVAGGATVAAAIPMTIFMVSASSNKGDYDDNLVGKAPVAEQQDARDTIQTQNALADVFMGLTLAGAATTVVLYVLRPGEDDTSTTAGGFGTDWSIAPAMGRDGGGASFRATF